MLLGVLTIQAQFARKNLTPQIPISELSAQQAEQLRANYQQRKGLGSDAIDPESTIGKANAEKLKRYKDSTEVVRTQRLALAGNDSLPNELTEDMPEVFGFAFFQQPRFSFMPGENFPTPAKYMIGPGDELELTIFGYQEAEMSFKVSPEGFINIPFGGLLELSGTTLEDAEDRIKVRMAKNGYRTLSSGESKLKLSVTKIRSINVYVVGAKNSGKYVIPSVSGLMHVLYVAGGPMENGSLRQVEVVRNGKVIRTVDLYDFMVYGRDIDDFVLQNEDVVRIPFFTKRVSVEGEFKRPMIYELRENETFNDAIAFAGGLNDAAFKDQILLARFEKNEGTKYQNLSSEAWQSVPMPGDRVIARKAEGPERNYVVVQGMVHNPGIQGWTPLLSLKEALRRAGGLQPEAFAQRGLIISSPIGATRRYAQFYPSSDLSTVFLSERDTVLIFNTTDFEDRKEVFVYGAVKAPGAFRYGEGLTVNDILALASGFSNDAYRGFVDINRKVRDRKQLSQIERLEIDSTLSIGSAGEIQLKPGDVVVVRPNPELKPTRNVTLEGEWLFPGVYGLQFREDRLSSVIGRSGGPTSQSDINGFYIIRSNLNPYRIKPSLPPGLMVDSTVEISSFRTDMDTIALNFNRKNTRNWNFVLRDGDRIIAQEKSSEVRINGAVQNPTLVIHVPGRRARYYLRAAGGSLKEGQVRRTYVTLPNGMSRKVRNYGVFHIYPRVPAGSTVTVPLDLIDENQDRKIDPAQVAMVSSVLGFLSTTLIGALSLLQ